jgi:NAD(P)-dependent dehydrogenase (short-subunit alcohol dehydrogenase family)
MERLLEGKVAIVTGGGTGIGAATARTFIREGAAVVISGRRQEPLTEVEAEIRATGGAIAAQQGDASDPDDIRRVVDRAVQEFGGVDILINNAGIHPHFKLVHETPVEEFDEFIAINLRGPFLMSRAAIPYMLERGGGAIVNMASMAAISGLKYTVSYGSSKGGLVHMTRVMALDYADKGITVNCVAPGGLSGTESNKLFTDQDKALARDSVGRGGPMPRQGTPEEVAELLLYLVGPYGGFTTGAIIPVDGGYTVW